MSRRTRCFGTRAYLARLRGAGVAVTLAAAALLLGSAPARAQVAGGAPPADTVVADTVAGPPMAQGGIYDRPFITGVGGTSVGGYVEGNTNWFVQDGVGEGLSMELRRFNIFLFSAVSPRIHFISELEFEHGTEEIALETALVDVRIRPSLVLRAGIILPPIGYLNQNHDSPKWNWVDRPLVTTEIIPSTLSEIGGGVHGRLGVGRSALSYELYLTNGLGDGIVENGAGRTHIPSGKREEQFAEDNNGSPALSARLGWRAPGGSEIGLSWYGATYNRFRVEGERVDDERRVDLVALDVGGSLGPLAVRGEAAWARVDVPPGMSELFGDRQWGGHLDLTLPLWTPRVEGLGATVLAADLRLEHVDFNAGRFRGTGGSIGDEVTAIVPGMSFRLGPEAVVRLNYRYAWITDLVGNEPGRLAGWQLGFATYF